MKQFQQKICFSIKITENTVNKPNTLSFIQFCFFYMAFLSDLKCTKNSVPVRLQQLLPSVLYSVLLSHHWTNWLTIPLLQINLNDKMELTKIPIWNEMVRILKLMKSFRHLLFHHTENDQNLQQYTILALITKLFKCKCWCFNTYICRS
jgi:hypothetical protein